jgi:hypothetical protein
MSAAVEHERFILTAKQLRERIVSPVGDTGKINLVAVASSGGIS